MKINKLGLVKYLIILGIVLWSLPTLADEIPVEPPTSTPETEVTSTPEILPPDDTETNTSTPEVVLATTTISLTVATSQETFSLPNLLVTSCPETEDSQVYSLNAMCALKQSGLTTEWSTFGTDMFLNSINSYANNWGDSIFWNWFADLNYGMSALNKHILTTNENLLLTYDLLPLKISTNSTTPYTNTSSTITLEEFGFEGFNPVWKPAINSTLSINGNLIANETGSYSLFTTTTDPINVFGLKAGFVSSATITLAPTSTSSSTQAETPTNPNTGGGSGSGTNNQFVSQEKINETVEKLLNFIKSKQESDGKIVDGGTSDWLAMSFGARNIYSNTVKNGNTSLYDYTYNYPTTELDSELNNCAAYPRHILALLASGVGNTDTTITTLKSKLSTCVTNNTFGANGINDDIFGLLAAVALQENNNSPVVQTTIAAIIANQQPSGAFAYPGPFESPDLTGAAVNALKYAQNNGVAVAAEVFAKAKIYLKAQQLTDGGWGFGTSDALTTGWAMMGINALGEGQNDWFNTAGKNPWHILTTLDNDHFTQSWDGNVDWFGTKHAIPALLGKSWPVILTPINNTQNQANSGSVGGSNPITSTTPENTSIIAPTSTPTTTTLAIVPETPTEPENIILVGEVLGERIVNESAKPTAIKKRTVVAQNTTAPLTQTVVSEPEAQPANMPAESATPDDVTIFENSNNHLLAKTILLVSSGGAVLIGLYLGIKNLKKK